jgi:hypothetical protein
MGRYEPAALPCQRVNHRVSPTRRRSAARQTPARQQRQDQPFSRRNGLVPLLPYPRHENSGLSGTWSCRHRRRTASGGPPLGASAAVAAVPLRCQPRWPPDDPEDRPRSTVPRLSRVLPRNTRLAGRRPAAPCAILCRAHIGAGCFFSSRFSLHLLTGCRIVVQLPSRPGRPKQQFEAFGCGCPLPAGARCLLDSPVRPGSRGPASPGSISYRSSAWRRERLRSRRLFTGH